MGWRAGQMHSVLEKTSFMRLCVCGQAAKTPVDAG